MTLLGKKKLEQTPKRPFRFLISVHKRTFVPYLTQAEDGILPPQA
jgi:hypothetical protein